MPKKVVLRIPASSEVYEAVLEEFSVAKVQIGKPRLATRILAKRSHGGALSNRAVGNKKAALAKS